MEAKTIVALYDLDMAYRRGPVMAHGLDRFSEILDLIPVEAGE
jgi:hypothetical protein